MADLTNSEKRKLERLFGMSSGYVLDFSNKTFFEFVEDHVNRDINAAAYMRGSGSKANRLRGFWDVESNHVVGNLIRELITHGRRCNAFKNDGALPEECERIVMRLLAITPVPDLDALQASVDDRDFEAIARQIREVIEKNKPEDGLDRLHTFTMRFLRELCERHGIEVTREKPLHSLFGEYVKKLREKGLLHSVMTERILKTNISVIQAFSDVRNDQSMAHDNKILNYDESLLIFNHIAALVRFIKTLEARIKGAVKPLPAADDFTDDIPF